MSERYGFINGQPIEAGEGWEIVPENYASNPGAMYELAQGVPLGFTLDGIHWREIRQRQWINDGPGRVEVVIAFRRPIAKQETNPASLSATHRLKTWPEFYSAIESGAKTFEARKNDRDFQVGDKLYLQEWHPTEARYTGRETVRAVSYILHGPAFGVANGFCIMGLESSQLTTLRTVIAKAEGMLRAFRYSMDKAVPFPSLEKLNETITLIQQNREVGE